MKTSSKSSKKKIESKLFVVRKYVWAPSATEAIKHERKQMVDDVWVDEDFKKGQFNKPDAIGFNAKTDYED